MNLLQLPEVGAGISQCIPLPVFIRWLSGTTTRALLVLWFGNGEAQDNHGFHPPLLTTPGTRPDLECLVLNGRVRNRHCLRYFRRRLTVPRQFNAELKCSVALRSKQMRPRPASERSAGRVRCDGSSQTWLPRSAGQWQASASAATAHPRAALRRRSRHRGLFGCILPFTGRASAESNPSLRTQ
jgi:hypothetical protein